MGNVVSRRAVLVGMGTAAGAALLASCSDDEEPPPPRATGPVNVRDLGAKGDGVSDDSAAFHKAVKMVAGGGVIVVPSGTYLVSEAGDSYACINLPSNASLTGKGTLAFATGVRRSAKLVSTSGKNVKVTGLSFDLSAAPAGQPFAVSLQRGASDVVLENLTISQNPVRGGIQILGATNVVVRGCNLSKLKQNGVTLYGRGVGDGPNNVLIENCVISSEVQPIDSEPVEGAFSRNLTVRNCQLTSTGGNYAVAFSGTEGARLEGGTLRGSLYLSGAKNCVVQNVTIDARGSRFHAVEASRGAHQVEFLTNTVTAEPGKSGIRIAKGGPLSPSGIVVSGNTFNVGATDGVGVDIDDATDVTVDKNNVVGVRAGIGIRVMTKRQDGRIRITGNRIRGFDGGVAAQARHRGQLKLDVAGNQVSEPASGAASFGILVEGSKADTRSSDNLVPPVLGGRGLRIDR